jgi:peptidyl-prolyl cis-trans isomerase D
MFDLFRSREKSVRYLLGALLVLVAASMLTYLIPNYDMGGGSGQEFIVARVGDDTIQLIDMQRALQNMMRSRQVPSEMMSGLIPQVLESMVTERALAYEAERQGFKVSEDDVAHAIREIVPSLFGPDGKFIGKEQYAAMLSQQNVTIQQFEREMARQVLVNRLRRTALEGVVVSPQEIEQEFRRRNEKISLEYVKLPAEKYRADVQVSAEEMKAHYDKNRNLFQTPEKRTLLLAVFDQAQLEQQVQVSEAELRRAYEQDKDRFRTPERVKVRHILLKIDAANPEAAVKGKAEALLKQIKGGGNFAELAKANSADTVSAQAGGELTNWVTRGQTVPEFEKVAFSLPVGQTSDLVKTQYGYHIIQVQAREEARLQPFAEAKAQLEPEVRRDRVSQEMDRLANEVQEALRRDPAQAQQIAQKFNVRLVDAPAAGSGDPLPEIGVNPDFEAAISGLRKGEVSAPFQAPGNKTVIAVVKEVIPAHPATFQEVESQIRETLAREKGNALLNQKAQELYSKAQSMGGDLRKAAQSMGLEVKTAEATNRQGMIEGVGSASYFNEAFAKPVGSLIAPVTVSETKVIAKVTARTDANLAELASQRDNLREELKNRKARERNALFEDGIRQRLTEEGKIRIYQDVLSRLAANYRG